MEANLLICKHYLWQDLLLYKVKLSWRCYLKFRNCKKFSNSFIFLDGSKIFVNKNAIKTVFHHNCDFYFSGEFYGEFCLFFSEFWKIFSRSTVCVILAGTCGKDTFNDPNGFHPHPVMAAFVLKTYALDPRFHESWGKSLHFLVWFN